MARNGSGVYSKPVASFVAGTTIESAKINSLIDDLVTDANTARPIVAGGTGGVSVITGWDGLTAKGTDIPSASTLVLTTATGPRIDITGVTAITAVTLAAGSLRIARATGIFVLTASATLLVNGSSSVNYTTKVGDLLIFEADSTVVSVWSISGGGGSTFSDSAFRIQDNADATKQLAFEVSGITTGNTRTATPPNASFTMAALDVAAQVVTGGARVTSSAQGTISSGTVTLDPGTRPLWDYTNNGAHTLAPGSNNGTILLDITNGASAGAITTSGWTKVVGAFDTTNAHKFRCSCSIGAAGSLLQIQPLF